MDHLLQPLRVIHKPLAACVFLELSVAASHVLLARMGFTRYECRGCYYWTRGLEPPASGDAHEVSVWDGIASDAVNVLSGGSAAPQDSVQDLLQEAVSACVVSSASVAAAPLRAVEDAVCGGGAAVSRGVAKRPEELQRADGLLCMRESEGEAAIFPERVAAQRAGARQSTGVAHRAPEASALPRAGAAQDPLCFLHGVGIGILPYLHFLAKLMRSFPSRPVLVVEVRGEGVGIKGLADEMSRLQALAHASMHALAASQPISHPTPGAARDDSRARARAGRGPGGGDAARGAAPAPCTRSALHRALLWHIRRRQPVPAAAAGRQVVAAHRSCA